jgi:small subunit ribosomal protein S6
MFIVKPTLTQEDSDKQVQTIQDIIKKNDGEIEATWDMGTKQLAYPIEKHSRGRYFVVYFKSKPDLIKELQRNYIISEDIIRFIIIKYIKEYEIENWQDMVNIAKNGGKIPEKDNKKDEEQPKVEAKEQEEPKVEAKEQEEPKDDKPKTQEK